MQRPDPIHDTATAKHSSLVSVCLTILTVLIVFAVLHQAKDIFAPVLTALLLGVVMTPLSDFWRHLKVPDALAAFISCFLALALILMLLLLAEPYVSQAISKAPVIWAELRGTVEQFKRLLQGIEQISENVEAAIEPSGPSDKKESERVSLPTLTDALFYAPQFAAQFMIFTGTLYFFLVVRNDLYLWAGKTFRRLGENGLRRAGEQVARYMLTITAINFGLGILTTIAMQILGMPSPVVWGVLAFALNYVLYLGPIVLICALTVTGIVMFDGATSFLPAAVYLSINATESQFVTPTLVGKSLSVNPLLVFLALVFWLWLWGPIGGIIAIPLLIWSLTVFRGLQQDQTISSGTPGRL